MQMSIKRKVENNLDIVDITIRSIYRRVCLFTDRTTMYYYFPLPNLVFAFARHIEDMLFMFSAEHQCSGKLEMYVLELAELCEGK
jgi:hypothetical protein